MEGELLQAAQLLFQELGATGREVPDTNADSSEFEFFLSLLEARGWPEAQPAPQTLSQAQRLLLNESPEVAHRLATAYGLMQSLGVLQNPGAILLVLLRLAEDRRERERRIFVGRPVTANRERAQVPPPSTAEWLRAAGPAGQSGTMLPRQSATIAPTGRRGGDSPSETTLSAPQLARQSLRDILMADIEPALARQGVYSGSAGAPPPFPANSSSSAPSGFPAPPASAASNRRPQYLDSYFPEFALVADLLLILQGLPGRSFALVKSETSGMWEFAARGEAIALPSHLVHCQRIADCGALLLRIQELLASAGARGFGASRSSSRRRLSQGADAASGKAATTSASRSGTLAAFCDALDREVNAYKRRVAGLEWYSVGGVTDSTFSFSAGGSFEMGQGTSPGQLSLSDLLSIANLLRKEVHSICVLADACLGHSSVRGIGILRVLYTFAKNGDPHLASLAGRLLCSSMLPLVEHIRRWISTGEIFDIHKEFFVRGAAEGDSSTNVISQNEKTSGAGPAANSASLLRNSSSNYFTSFSLWVGPEACPYPLLTVEEAKMFFDTGRAAAFLRTGCQDFGFQLVSDSDSTELDAISHSLSLAAAKLSEPLLPCRTALSQLASLSSKMLREASSRALKLLFDKHHLIDHLDGILRCLLGQQGDFTLALLSAFSAAGVGPGLAQKASGLYSLSANSLLDGAIAASNASLLPKYVQESLVIRLPGQRPLGPGTSERGDASKAPWASPELLDSAIPFTLSYSVPRPLDTVITPYAVSVYEKAFRMMYSLHCCGAALDKVESLIISFGREQLHANFGRPLRPGQASEGSQGALGNPSVAKAMKVFLKRASLVRSRFQIMTRSVLTFSYHEIIDKVCAPLLRLRPQELCGEGGGAGGVESMGGVEGAPGSRSETGMEELLVRHEDALLRLSYGLMLEGFVQKEVRGYSYYAGARVTGGGDPAGAGLPEAGSAASGSTAGTAEGRPLTQAILVENSAFTRFQLALRRLLDLSLRLGEIVDDALQGLKTINTLEATATLEQGRRMIEALDSDLASEADEMAQCLERSVNLQVSGMDFQIFSGLADDLRSCVGGRRLRPDAS